MSYRINVVNTFHDDEIQRRNTVLQRAAGFGVFNELTACLHDISAIGWPSEIIRLVAEYTVFRYEKRFMYINGSYIECITDFKNIWYILDYQVYFNHWPVKTPKICVPYLYVVNQYIICRYKTGLNFISLDGRYQQFISQRVESIQVADCYLIITTHNTINYYLVKTQGVIKLELYKTTSRDRCSILYTHRNYILYCRNNVIVKHNLENSQTSYIDAQDIQTFRGYSGSYNCVVVRDNSIKPVLSLLNIFTDQVTLLNEYEFKKYVIEF